MHDAMIVQVHHRGGQTPQNQCWASSGRRREGAGPARYLSVSPATYSMTTQWSPCPSVRMS